MGLSTRNAITRHLIGGLASFVIVIAGTTACGSTASDVRSDAGVSVSESESDVATFRLVADVIGGGSLSLDDELAVRPVALWFWAPG